MPPKDGAAEHKSEATEAEASEEAQAAASFSENATPLRNMTQDIRAAGSQIIDAERMCRRSKESVDQRYDEELNRFRARQAEKRKLELSTLEQKCNQEIEVHLHKLQKQVPNAVVCKMKRPRCKRIAVPAALLGLNVSCRKGDRCAILKDGFADGQVCEDCMDFEECAGCKFTFCYKCLNVICPGCDGMCGTKRCPECLPLVKYKICNVCYRDYCEECANEFSDCDDVGRVCDDCLRNNV
eukprot:gnl/TRDRNA2_/TRDRNA2_173524_c0_seq1.p1 gnl/TRDRNA2_/TRDRNA2_173524_c0~~gnl/TRDRNA2_/TRDRNA2_173524_c0_seq1.p1  ORF type:complete len:261 (+),score=30.17 gnl/TRDRNA2_/TRDRNA2_173524_c0_seq1:64-783(+)